ncbi:MAG TPA: DUF1343 domain-containing protein [Rhabdochlamydiaceae bacterium]|nr:DUF1343 domain-containing protein [Rhabdochlamydiaceae bacterium]
MKYLCLVVLFCGSLFAQIQLGVDVFFQEERYHDLKGKKVALLTNHTGVDGQQRPTLELLQQVEKNFKIVALFCPEHGLKGVAYAAENVANQKEGKLTCFSLHGSHRRPTAEMLKGIDAIICDIQEIGCRSYTYATTLYYVMEEAAKRNIDVLVLDRPNPLGGMVVDGPMLDDSSRSFLGYINVPYCHGMTIGELAWFFNQEYQVKCKLKVIPMKGWKRDMTYQETGLVWIPTSPQIPEADTPFFYPATGLLGELQLVSIGIGYTLPFKVVGAPWIEAKGFVKALNDQNLKGVKFLPFHFKPYFGPYKNEECHGVRLVITDPKHFRPASVAYIIMGVLKSLYPKEVLQRLKNLPVKKRALFCKANGNTVIWDLLLKEKYAGWKMVSVDKEERKAFLEKRQKYLLY